MAEERNETTPLLLDSSSIRSSASTLECDQTTSSTDSDVESSAAFGIGIPDSEIGAATARDTQTKPADQPSLSTSSLLQIVAVLAIGLFTSNLDGSIVLATHPRIASEFHALEESSWLFISFFLAGVATQTLYAKLSDIYGRKWLLIFGYALFAIGLTMIGCAQSMWQVILGRAISGSGGSGMASLGMVLVTDLIPLREVGTWHGYINMISTTGRSLGGPVGGWLADQVGWRWSFLGQAPMFLLAIVAAICVIPNTRGKPAVSNTEVDTSKHSLLTRIDFAGSLLLGLSILMLMLPIELGGTKIQWSHPAIFVLFGIGVVLLLLFLATEAWWATHPVFPIRILKNREILASYFIIGCIAAAQTSLMFSVPLYFQVTQRVSNTEAGAHLFPAVFGNAVGGLTVGRIIRRTGSYKGVAVAASVAGIISYALVIARWTGYTNWWESMYILLGGLGAGMANTTIFVAVNAIVEPAHKAVAASGLFLSMMVGMITGIAATSALMMGMMQKHLDEGLIKLGMTLLERKEIISKAAENVEYIYRLDGPVADAVSSAYVVGLRWSYGVSLACSVFAFGAALSLRDRRV